MTRTDYRISLAAAPVALTGMLASTAAQASLFQGETLDAFANGISGVVLILVPVVVLVVFWLVHSLPEKIAEKRKHPQGEAAARYASQVLRVQSEQLIQRVNLRLALGGSFAEPVTVAATTPK